MATAAQPQRRNTHGAGFEAVAFGDIARERAQRGRLMVPTTKAADGPVAQCRLKVRVNRDARNPIYEPYTELWDFDMDFEEGETAYDNETRTYYIFVDVSNRAFPKLKNLTTNKIETYDAKRDAWVVAPLLAPATSALTTSAPSNAPSRGPMDLQTDAPVPQRPPHASLSLSSGATGTGLSSTPSLSSAPPARAPRKSRWDSQPEAKEKAPAPSGSLLFSQPPLR